MSGRIRILVSGCIFVAGFAGPAEAQGLRKSVPNDVIDRVFDRYNSKSTPGCSVAVVDRGRVVFNKSYGMADPALGVPMTSAITSWIPYSEARVFVAIAVGRLAGDGQISLDDPIRRYVPQVPAHAGAVTIRHLLHHTSGLADYGILAGPGFELGDRLSEDEFFRMLNRWNALGSRPGSSRMYSNTDYALLKILVERVSGASLHDYLHRILLRPAGMSATRIGLDQAQALAGHALFHEAYGNGYRRLLRYRISPVGGIAVTTNLNDIVRLDRMLREPTWSAMLKRLEPGAPTSGNANEGFGFGIYKGSQNGIPSVEYRGIGQFTFLAQFPSTNLSVATLCNAYSGMDTFASQVAALYLSPVQPARKARPIIASNVPVPKLVIVSQAELKSFEGEYRDQSGGVTVDVSVVEGVLSVQPRGRPAFPTPDPLGGGRFATTLGNQPYVLEFKSKDSAMTLTSLDANTNEPGGPPLTRRVSWQPKAVDLKAYTGVYQGDKVEIRLHLRADGEHLLLATSGFAESRLSPDKPDQFRLPDTYEARFERGANGQVIGVVLDANRLQGIRFTKAD